MFSLQDLLGAAQGDQAVNQISQNVGAEPSLVCTAIQAALPLLIGGLANNASTPDGAQSLNNTLDQNHDGSVLDNIEGLAGRIFGSGQAAASPATDAGGILTHILGNNQGQVAQTVSNQSGLGIGQVSQILMFLAPIVMGYLGRQKQQQGVGADGIGSLVGGLLGGQAQGQSVGGTVMNMASNALDTDHDGSAIDDIASMAFKYISGK